MEPSDWMIVGVVVVLIALGGGIQAYSTFGTDVPDGFYMNHAMERALDDMLKDLPEPADDEFWRVAVVPLKSDRQGKVARAVADRLRSVKDGAKFRGPDPDYVSEELEKDFKAAVIVDSEMKAAQIGAHLGVDVVAWGQVDSVKDDEDVTEVCYQLAFEKMPAGKIEPQPRILGKVQVVRRMPKSLFSLDYVRLRLSQTSTVFRVLLWFVIAAGLPFALYPIELKIFEAESNGLNMAVLFGLVGITLLSALALNGFAFSGVWVVLYIGLVVGSAMYYLALLNALQESD